MCTITIGQTLMTSEDTDHTAQRIGKDKWRVTYVPSRVLSTAEALAAMRAAANANAMERAAVELGTTVRGLFELLNIAETHPVHEELTTEDRFGWKRLML